MRLVLKTLLILFNTLTRLLVHLNWNEIFAWFPNIVIPLILIRAGEWHFVILTCPSFPCTKGHSFSEFWHVVKSFCGIDPKRTSWYRSRCSHVAFQPANLTCCTKKLRFHHHHHHPAAPLAAHILDVFPPRGLELQMRLLILQDQRLPQ